MKTFAEKFIGNIETAELDSEYPFYDGSDNDFPNEILTSSQVDCDSSMSMDIDKALEILNKLKESGANRVYIGYHTDHFTYMFSGVKLKEID